MPSIFDIDAAISVATYYHAGQKDKMGQPYILHPLRVMLKMKTDDERIVAILHDVVEDTIVTLDQLTSIGFSSTVVEAVDAITRREGEVYSDYIRRVGENEIARLVKLADLEDNMSPERMQRYGMQSWEEHKSLMKRYTKARDYLIDVQMDWLGG